MTVTALQRIFEYNQLRLTDPGGEFTTEQVKEFYADTYPKLTTASIEGPDVTPEGQVYRFVDTVGTKGSVSVSVEEIAEGALAPADGTAIPAECFVLSAGLLEDLRRGRRAESGGVVLPPPEALGLI